MPHMGRWQPEGVCVLVTISGLLGVSTKGVFVWRVFFVGGTKEWLMRFRECPDPEGFPTSMICEFTSSP